MREPEEAASAYDYAEYDDAPADGAMYQAATGIIVEPLPPQAAPAPAPVPQTARSSAPLPPLLVRRFFPESWLWHTARVEYAPPLAVQ